MGSICITGMSITSIMCLNAPWPKFCCKRTVFRLASSPCARTGD
jgi:hypothetical protein